MVIRKIETSAALLSVREAPGPGPAVLMIHGNSGSKEAFDAQFEAFAGDWHLIAVDLPGHGASSNATDPERNYTLAGYAACLRDAVVGLGGGPVVVVGVSLGGHIALELSVVLPIIVGIMLCGTSPFAAHTLGDLSSDRTIRAAIARADGIARSTMAGALLTSDANDQRSLAERSAMPIAIVNGADDRFVNLDYLEALTHPHLWSGRAYRIPGAGHAPQLTHPDLFNPILRRFVQNPGV